MIESVSAYSHEISVALIVAAVSFFAKYIFNFLFAKEKKISLYRFEDITWDKKMHAISRFNTLFFGERSSLETLELRFVSNFLTHRNEADYCYGLLKYISLRKLDVTATLKIAKNHCGLIRISERGCADVIMWKVYLGFFLLFIFSIALGILLPLQVVSLCNIFIDHLVESRFLVLFKVIKSFSWTLSFIGIYIIMRIL
ncbi:hypothetical protein, partial [Yersinia alsatica]|uniref:hypothetical protein n=1 Tax=Yersinia alsatica TaxID=2890317 RepID=UPI00119C9FDB